MYFIRCIILSSIVAVVSGCCMDHCAQVNGNGNESPAELDAKVAKMCADMGRKGKPEIQERTKSSVSAYCPE